MVSMGAWTGVAARPVELGAADEEDDEAAGGGGGAEEKIVEEEEEEEEEEESALSSELNSSHSSPMGPENTIGLSVAAFNSTLIRPLTNCTVSCATP
jgi:hypothetical protein